MAVCETVPCRSTGLEPGPKVLPVIFCLRQPNMAHRVGDLRGIWMSKRRLTDSGRLYLAKRALRVTDFCLCLIRGWDVCSHVAWSISGWTVVWPRASPGFVLCVSLNSDVGHLAAQNQRQMNSSLNVPCGGFFLLTECFRPSKHAECTKNVYICRSNK